MLEGGKEPEQSRVTGWNIPPWASMGMTIILFAAENTRFVVKGFNTQENRAGAIGAH